MSLSDEPKVERVSSVLLVDEEGSQAGNKSDFCGDTGQAPTPTEGEDNVTAGNQEYEASSASSTGPTPGLEMVILSTNATPSGEGSSIVFESDDTNIELLHKKGGDCGRIYPYRICLSLCILIALALFILCFIYYPKPLQLCLKLSLDEEIMENVFDDVGNYKLNITNPNSIDVDIHGLEISAYYGGVAEENWLLNSEMMDYHIPSHSTVSSNHTYTFIQNCTAAVPITTLDGCYAGYRAYITFDIVTSFKACILSCLCHEGIVSKSQYESNCPEDDMVCTDLELFLV